MIAAGTERVAVSSLKNTARGRVTLAGPSDALTFRIDKALKVPIRIDPEQSSGIRLGVRWWLMGLTALAIFFVLAWMNVPRAHSRTGDVLAGSRCEQLQGERRRVCIYGE